jgi:hypothetical protein
VFSVADLDCIAGVETGQTFNASIVAKNGRVGLYQFNQAIWSYSGTSISWDGGKSAKDPNTATAVAIGLLYRDLGYDGVANPTQAAITEAIDKFGEHDGRYGQAVVDCAKKVDAGDFDGGMSILKTYSQWVADGRPQ